MANLATFNQALRSEKTKAMVVTALQGNANEYFRNIASLVANDPKLQQCNEITLICGGLQAASLSLPLTKGLGFAYLIPYSNHGKMEAQFQLGYKGIVQLALRSGQIKHLNVTEVYEGEISKYDRKKGITELNGTKKSEKVVGYLAIMELVNGAEQELYMSKEDVVKHGKRFSKTYTSGPWQTDFDAMAKKTVLKALLNKYAPLSVEMASAMQADQAVIRENNVMDYVDNPESGDSAPADDLSPERDEQMAYLQKKAEEAKARAKKAVIETTAQVVEPEPAEGDVFDGYDPDNDPNFNNGGEDF